MSPKEQSKYIKSWTEAYAEVRAKTEEQMGPTGVVLELSHEDWEKMQNGATLEELKSVKEMGYGMKPMKKMKPMKSEDADADMKAAQEKKKREKPRELEKHFRDQEAGSSHAYNMPPSASSMGKQKDRTAGHSSTQVTRQKSQFHSKR